jgi:4-amino-4-deoxychorismate lyase
VSNLLGDGVFRTILVEDQVPLYLESHLQKLQNECAKMHIQAKLPTLSEITSYIQKKGIWRLKIAVVADERLNLKQWVSGTSVISIKPYTPSSIPQKLCIYPEPFHRLNPKIKSLSFLDQLTLFTYAQERGYDEVLTVNQEGYVLEGAFCNVFFEEDNVLYFMDRSLPYYEGLTQERIMQETSKEVHFVKITPDQLKGKRLYTCNSLKSVLEAQVK